LGEPRVEVGSKQAMLRENHFPHGRFLTRLQGSLFPKTRARQEDTLTASSFAVIFFSVSMNALAQIALRKAMLTLGALPSMDQPITLIWTVMSNVYLLCGLSLYLISIGSWLTVLSSTQVSVAYPMLSIGYVIAAVFSFLLLGEAMSLTRLLGIAVICLGVILISRTT